MKAWILICALTTPIQDCNKTNAKDVIIVPVQEGMSCSQVGMITLSQTILLNNERYPKIICRQ